MGEGGAGWGIGIELLLVVGGLYWFYRSQMRAVRQDAPAKEEPAERAPVSDNESPSDR